VARHPRKRPPKTAVYRGHFGRAQAERLLWRAGFGPRRGEVERFAAMGLDRAVRSLTRPKIHSLSGPAPRVDGAPLAPMDAWGHDVLWWMDRMVRSRAPLAERMTLVWHDWFATSRDSVEPRWMIKQNELFRSKGMGSFKTLLKAVTTDPAMLVWLNGTQNTRWAPNENYARELQELFTLGAGRGYTETDVREIARALTGFTTTWSNGIGFHDFKYQADRHDAGVKRIYGRTGRFTWSDACELVVGHRNHPAFLVTKLWGYFIPTPPSAATRRALQRVYVGSGHRITPLLEAILKHPDLYRGPRMVKPPVVFTVGLLRALGKGIDTDAWSWIGEMSGQLPFYPPNVSGWDDSRWMDTATFRGRWTAANYALEGRTLNPDPRKTSYPADEAADEAVDAAWRFWGRPALSSVTRRHLLGFARDCDRAADQPWKRVSYRIQRQNALRMLIATAPDLQTS
jgi:uncharacterized protein (DUF1800 family)